MLAVGHCTGGPRGWLTAHRWVELGSRISGCRVLRMLQLVMACWWLGWFLTQLAVGPNLSWGILMLGRILLWLTEGLRGS